MYFPIGWPKAINLALPNESATINHICCDAVKILVAAVGDNFLGVFYTNPLIPIAFYRRSVESVASYGANKIIVWKPDSRQLAILTSAGILILYQIDFNTNEGGSILTQVDPPTANLKRDSAELFIKENIPRLSLRELGIVRLQGSIISTVCCISLLELLVATDQCELIRMQWSELEANQGGNIASVCAPINLRNIPFYVSHNCSLKNLPPIGCTSYVATLEYSPFIGGCAVVFSDCRSAFLIATHLRFEAQNMHGFWVPDVEDASICSVNHKFRLLAYGRHNSDVTVYAIEDATGGLEFSHRLSLNSNVIPGTLGAVSELKWSPDGCVIAVAWQNGGISLWSTFGALLMSTFNWDFGINMDLINHNPLQVCRLEWCTEGYQLFLICKKEMQQGDSEDQSNVMQLNFVKSTLTMNPCMTSHTHLLLQGEDTLYLNQGDNLEKMYFGSKFTFPNSQGETPHYMSDRSSDDTMEVKKTVDISSILSESKYWSVVQLPLTYAATNWPIRYSAIDSSGLHLAVAGRTGLAHYSMLTKKWKLFGNESQEKDFVVSGGLLWWQSFVVMGCYSLLDRTDEIRCYPEECKLDNQFGNKIQVRAPVISLNMFRDQLIALTADGIVSLFELRRRNAYSLIVDCSFEVDVKSICIHPACIVSLTVTNLKNELTTKSVAAGTASNEAAAAETIIVNVCGRILMIQRDARHSSVINSLMVSCLASCVECFWLSNSVGKSPMRDCLWLYSGAHGMRVWLPILPPTVGEQVHDAPHRRHTFMSKRIMLSFPLKLYPLVILFDNVIVLGVENETTLYTSASSSHFALPFNLLERKSQIYLHKILRQLIKRNLGYSAWEIAKSCRSLPYFPHALELLLHEVLEEEATSKEPIPDALLPSILDFIREFPVYLQTIVQCARKTEIALWPYLFSMAGKPKDLFQQCLQADQLDTAASYLIILQNLEPSLISKQYATLLLDIALQHRKWELAKDLVRFLKAIDPNEIESPRSSMVINVKIAPPSSQAQSQVNQHPDAFNLVLGPIARERSFSTTVTTNLSKEKKEKPSAVAAPATASSGATTAIISNDPGLLSTGTGSNSGSQIPIVPRRRMERNNSTKERKESFSIDVILQRHARQLLQNCKLIDLGYMSAFLDFHLVTWLSQETDRAARLNDFVVALTDLHEELQLPSPLASRTASEVSSISFPVEYTQLQHAFSLDNGLIQPHTSSHTSESGYFSLALMDTPTSTNNGNAISAHISSIKEDEEIQCPSLPMSAAAVAAGVMDNVKTSRSNSQLSFDNSRYHRFLSQHESDVTTLTALELDSSLHSDAAHGTPRILSDKLGIKMRYLLQLFIEANCTDYALVLSILLQDAASIGRIINVVIRSESLAACIRIESALKSLTQWSFDRDCLYRSFMISLQPHIYLLDQYIKTNTDANGASNVARKTDGIEVRDASTAGVNIDNLNHLLQSNHIQTANANRSLGTFAHDGQCVREIRAINADISKNTHIQSGRHGGRRISNGLLKGDEPGGCSVM